jgi:hypothetical protein
VPEQGTVVHLPVDGVWASDHFVVLADLVIARPTPIGRAIDQPDLGLRAPRSSVSG